MNGQLARLASMSRRHQAGYVAKGEASLDEDEDALEEAKKQFAELCDFKDKLPGISGSARPRA